MNTLGKIFNVLCCIVLFSSAAAAQTFSEDFTGLTTSTNLAGQSSWTKGGTGPDATVDNSSPLTFAGYNSGGAEYVVMPTGTSTSSRVYKTFGSPVTFASGSTIYYSVLLRLASTSATGTNYFMSFGSPGTGTSYGAKLFAVTNGTGTYNIGLSKTSNTAAFGSTLLNLNTTYLVVVRYTFHNLGIAHADSIDDEAYLWVNPSNGSEPSTGAAECSIASGTGATDYDGFASPPTQVGNFIWHNRGTNNPTGSFDGIRVGYGTTSALAWADLNPGPLPVEINSLSAQANHLSAQVRWSTATETDNFGFDIQRKSAQTEWEKVGFVNGAGTSAALHNYSFADNVPQAGLYEYRIKQIDKNGSSKYSPTVEVEVGAVAKVLSLGPNYPNPFNPSTSIEFSVPMDGRVTLKIYNVVGQEVATLFDGITTAGKLQKATFDASRLPSGVYFSRLDFGGKMLVKRMMLLK